METRRVEAFELLYYRKMLEIIYKVSNEETISTKANEKEKKPLDTSLDMRVSWLTSWKIL